MPSQSRHPIAAGLCRRSAPTGCVDLRSLRWTAGTGQGTSGPPRACPARCSVCHRLREYRLRPQSPRPPALGDPDWQATKQPERHDAGRLRREGRQSADPPATDACRAPCGTCSAQTNQGLAGQVLRLPLQPRRPCDQQHIRARDPPLSRVPQGHQRLQVQLARPDPRWISIRHRNRSSQRQIGPRSHP
jgi:hypothetical protein